MCSFCHVALIDMPFCFLVQNFAEIGQSVDDLWPKKRFSRWRPPPSWILKISIFGHVSVTGFNIWCSVPNFIKIGRPPYWILTICSFYHVALVDMPFWFLLQNFAEIGKLVDKLWPKKSIFKMAAAAILNFKNFNFWSRDCYGAQYLL